MDVVSRINLSLKNCVYRGPAIRVCLSLTLLVEVIATRKAVFWERREKSGLLSAQMEDP